MRRRPPLRFALAKLQAVVSPVPVLEVLASLVRAGAIEGFERRGWEVLVWGNGAAVELALAQREAAERVSESHREVRDGRAEYYREARAFERTAAFRRLPRRSREIWRLHAQGASHRAICLRLGLGFSVVQASVRGARLLAGLPELVRNTPSAARPPRPCTAQEGCAAPARAKGLCWPHYAQHRRRAAG